MSAPVCSRRVSAGITPAPGTTSRLTVWWGRTDWLEVEVRGTVREAVEVCRDHHVAPDTVIKVAAAHAEFADTRTGRDCRPTNERLVEAAQCSLSTVQRARRVLIELGLMVEVVAGRTNMTLQQRLAAHERGSSHRSIAAEFVLCSRRDRRPRLVENTAADLQVVERDTPPVGKVVRASVQRDRGLLRDGEPQRGGRCAPAHTEKSRPAPAGGPDPRARTLAVAVKARVAWLRDVPTSRMVPLLTKFARAGWSGDDVRRAAEDAMAARGWGRVPRELRSPAAYLAGLLREVDPADRPGALDEWMAATKRAEASAKRDSERRYVAALKTTCPHGVPAGDVPSPLRGSLACPACRASAAAG